MARGVLLAAVAALALCAAGTSAAGKPAGTFTGCPSGLVAVPAGYAAQARHAATVFLTTTYAAWNRERHWKLRLAGAEVGTPLRVTQWLPSGWIKSECGTTVWSRSVAVPIRFPAMEYPNPKGPCNACAHVTFLLGRTAARWVVWGNY